MKFFILSLLLFFCLVNATQVYTLHLVIYKNDTVELKGLNTNEGVVGVFPSPILPANNYSLKIVTADGLVLFNQVLDISFINPARFRGPNAAIHPEDYVNSEEHTWNLPYSDEAASIQLFHGDKLIFNYEINHELNHETLQFGFADFYPLICLFAAIIIVVLIVNFKLARGDKK